MKTIVFEGLDGSFKQTNAKRVTDYINDNTESKAVLVSFPNYDSPSSYFVKENLAGKYKLGEDSTYYKDAYKTCLFYALDRYDTFQKLDLTDCDYLILDRYYTSNMIYQSANLKVTSKIEKLCQKIIKLETEYLGLPRPDRILYMDIPIGITKEILLKKEDKDAYENDIKFLEAVHDVGNIIKLEYGWENIKCTNLDGTLRSEDEIFDEIISSILYLRKR